MPHSPSSQPEPDHSAVKTSQQSDFAHSISATPGESANGEFFSQLPDAGALEAMAQVPIQPPAIEEITPAQTEESQDHHKTSDELSARPAISGTSLASGEKAADLELTGDETLIEAGWEEDVAQIGEESDDIVEIAPPIGVSARRNPKASNAHADFDTLFLEWTRTRDPQIRERLILMNRNLVSYIARRFMDRGEMSEDIVQQGLIGLINALDHFDPTRGVRFATFATPTIMGEIRRYFRDKSWGIRVPRRLQELNQLINNRIEDLTQELNRSPTYIEIARSLNLPLEEVVEALEMGSVMEPISIDEDVSFGSDDAGRSVGDQIGVCDPQLEGWGDYAALETALQLLPEKERRVLEMAYFKDHSQVEIARQMKVSQMFVSRLQRRALAHLRELMNSQDI